MSELLLRAGWSDPDLIEIEAEVSFDSWGGYERAYVTRGELAAFADALDAVAGGGTEASLIGGQHDLSYVELRVYEYGGARRLAVVVAMGRAGNGRSQWPHGETCLRFAMPIERGTLPGFAKDIRRIVTTDKGEATIPVLNSWP